MKKFLFLLMFILSTCMALAAGQEAVSGTAKAEAKSPEAAQAVTQAAQEKTIIKYSASRHRETAANIFMLWGGASGAAGVMTAFGSDQVTRGFGIGMLVYGIVETTFAVIDRNMGMALDDNDSRKRLVSDSGWAALAGIGQLVGGMAIAFFGNDSLKGYGIAVALQGGFFTFFDGMNYFIANNPVDVRDWKAGITIRYELAGTKF